MNSVPLLVELVIVGLMVKCVCDNDAQVDAGEASGQPEEGPRTPVLHGTLVGTGRPSEHLLQVQSHLCQHSSTIRSKRLISICIHQLAPVSTSTRLTLAFRAFPLPPHMLTSPTLLVLFIVLLQELTDPRIL
jgi:hypothetical protein